MFRALLDFLLNARFHVTSGLGADFETPYWPPRSLALTPYLAEMEIPPGEVAPVFETRDFFLLPVGLLGFRRRPTGRAFRIAAPDGHCLPVIELRW